MTPLPLMEAALVAAIALGFSGGLIAWGERPEPGAVPLTILLAGQCWWSATTLFRMTASGATAKIFWVDVSWLGIALLPVAWLAFSLSYTGYDQYLRPRYLAVFSALPVLTIVFGLTNPIHHFMYEQSSLVSANGTIHLMRDPGIWFWVIAGYTYLLGLLGAIPILGFLRSEVGTFQGQSFVLLIGLVVPWVTNVLYLLGLLPTGGIDPTPVAFAISGMAFLGALTRFQLLGTSPAPIRPARRSIFDRMEGGIIVLDRRDNIVELNGQAAAALSAHTSEALGQPAEAVIPQFENLTGDRSQSGEALLHSDDRDGMYDMSITSLEDAHGRTAGRIITLHDISEYIRQQQRLEVLNRVFRHNIRTNTQVILSHAEYLGSHNSPSRAKEVQERALEIEAFGEKIRSILDSFERGRKDPEPISLDKIVQGGLETVSDEYPDLTIDSDIDEEAASVFVDRIMDRIFLNTLQNAAGHNDKPDPRLSLEVTTNEDRVRLVVSDNGPGINDEELALLNGGSETPLHHGSGLGLALIVWGTDILGGTVTFENNEPTGTTVILEVPILSKDGAEG